MSKQEGAVKTVLKRIGNLIVDGIVITLITGMLLFAIITIYGESILDFLRSAIGG